MKATLLNGSLPGDRSMADIHALIIKQLQASGCEVRSFTMHELKINHCVGCFQCWVKTPGICRFKDDAQQIAREFINNHLSILLTPVTFGGYSSQLKKALDRIICLVSPFFMSINGEVHHQPRYDRYPNLLGLGVLPTIDPASEHIFARLVERNSINMHSPAHHAEVLINDRGIDSIERHIRNGLAKVGIRQ